MKLSLATKIFLGFNLVLGVFAAIPIFNFLRMDEVRDRLVLLGHAYNLTGTIADFKTLESSTRRSIDNVFKFDGIPSDSSSLVTRQQSLLRGAKRWFQKNIERHLADARAELASLNTDRLESTERLLSESFAKRLDQIEQESKAFITALDLVQGSLAQVQDLSSVLTASELAEQAELNKPLSRLGSEVSWLDRDLKRQIKALIRELEWLENSSIAVVFWLTILATVVGILVTALSVLALRPIRRLIAAAQDIAKGEFTQTADENRGDEFGVLSQEFNRMSRALAQREKQFVGQQEQLESINHKLRQSSIDLELMRLYSEHIIRSMPNAVLVADARGVVTTLNPEAARLWELAPDQTVGRKLEALPIAGALRPLLQDWDRVLRNRAEVALEAVPFGAPGRSSVFVDLHLSPVVSSDGNTHGVLLVGEDVTERVRTKQALLQSERMAAIGRMSAVVAHEIRNPLSALGLNFELLEEELQGSDTAKKLFYSIAREIARLEEITDEYLRFARLPKPNLQSEDLNAMLRNLLFFLRSELEAASILAVPELRAEPGLVLADEGQLHQALMNLLKNAIQSMPEGGTLHVSTAQENGAIRVVIADTGIGIKPENLERIFDPFFSTRTGGTGLGLSLTHQIVVEHGGRISCTSTPGEGTEFSIELVAADAPAEGG